MSRRICDTRSLLVGQTMLTDNHVLSYDNVGWSIMPDDGRQSPGYDYGKLIPNLADAQV